MPDVIGQDKDEAKKLLENDEYGLVVTFEYQASDAYEANKVIRTDPEKKTDIYYGDTVTIFVSQGADTSNAKVPDIRNMSQERAKSEMEGRGLSLRVEGEVYSSTVAVGNIVAQDIKPDKVVPRGTTIGVTVSKGPEPTTPEPTTPEPTTPKPTPEPTTPEPTTPEPTTPEPTFTAVFPSPSASFKDKKTGEIVNSSDINGGNVTAVLSYQGKTEPITDMIDNKVYNSSWSQKQITITKKDVEKGVEATITFEISYKITNEQGEEEERTAFTTTTAVFN